MATEVMLIFNARVDRQRNRNSHSTASDKQEAGQAGRKPNTRSRAGRQAAKRTTTRQQRTRGQAGGQAAKQTTTSQPGKVHHNAVSCAGASNTVSDFIQSDCMQT